jgi:predicted DNA-binding transcriptional regulator YafY
MSTTINKKINHIFLLLEKLSKGEELYSQHEGLIAELDVNQRTLDRYLKDIHSLYGHIVRTEKKSKEFSERKVTAYRVVDKKKDISEIFKFFIENSADLSWLLQLVHENNPSLLDESDDKELLEESIKQDKDIFLFKSNPLEHLSDEKNKLFSIAKMAVKNHEYRSIEYKYRAQESITDVKLLKLIFMNNNWYLAIEQEDNLRLLRFNFITSLQYAKKSNYQGKVLDKYNNFFIALQNPMTLDTSFSTARLLASPNIAIYFKESMKPFFPSQKFIKENEDGSIEFSLHYTQPIEIMPFIKQWQPDMIIVSPSTLKDKLLADMKKSINNYS